MPRPFQKVLGMDVDPTGCVQQALLERLSTLAVSLLHGLVLGPQPDERKTRVCTTSRIVLESYRDFLSTRRPSQKFCTESYY